MRNPDPTPEQGAILDAFATGETCTIVAAAGSGKTTSLRMLAGAAGNRRGLYVAYNKAIATDAEGSFPRGTECRTAHSLAYRAVGARYRQRLNGPRVSADRTAAILGINQALHLGDHHLQPRTLARLAQETVGRFCFSADDDLHPWHVPAVAGMEDTADRDTVRATVLPYARAAWAELQQTSGQLRFTHDMYLKIWGLSRPVLPFDFILFDECQPPGTMVTVPVGAANPKRGMPTQTAEVPIESLKPGDRVVSYDSKGLRLRPTGSVLADVRSHWHAGRLITVTTPSGRTSRYTPEHKCLVSVGGALAGRQVVYLMRRGGSFRVGVTSGLSPSGNAGPRVRLQEERGDEAWVLSTHDTRADALAAEAFASWRYGLPQMRFMGTAEQQPSIDAFWNKVGDLWDAARLCLREHGRMLDYPLWSRGVNTYTLTHRLMVVRACNLMDGMGVIDAAALLDARGQRRPTQRQGFAPVRVASEPYDGLVWTLEVDRDHTYVADGLVTHNCQDANPVVLDVICRQEAAQLVAVGDPNQAIYGWRGAVDAMDQFGGHRLYLSKSFRFGPAVADEANKWLAILAAELRVTGFERINSEVGPLTAPDAILCRTNAKAIAAVMGGINEGRRVALVGGGDEMVRLAQAAVSLKAGIRTEHPELCAFRTWGDVQDYVEHDAAGTDLKVFVRLVDQHGADVIIDTLQRLTRDEARADLIISTAHKAKGREWNSVQVATDFREPKQADDGRPGKVAREDAMLAYVTVTRAKLQLDPAGVAWVDSYVPALAPVPASAVA